MGYLDRQFHAAQPHIIPILHEQVPQMALMVEENYTARLSEKLRQGELDADAVIGPREVAGRLGNAGRSVSDFGVGLAGVGDEFERRVMAVTAERDFISGQLLVEAARHEDPTLVGNGKKNSGGIRPSESSP